MQKPTLRCSGKELKQWGQARAVGKHSDSLYNIQVMARMLGRHNETLTIETVHAAYEMANGHPWDLGNAAGSVFSGKEWECVGYKAATRPEAHARILRVWRLKS